ncbi:alpha/beta fold hydrolase [Agilicoccus flavus]|uniref:alpha/beta fold hydrolase n=1 Tax=Agilicoccus flavus TaxID=2775968 RepID=UPI001CF70993|nr:alpha/beta fold hydrolase [Agilicoccus flavus]
MRNGVPRDSPQRVRFARSSDGTTIAYAVHGSGPALVLDSCWLSHLEFDWQSPVWRHYLVELGRAHTVVRFDERGHGLSDRDVTDFGLERRIDDLCAVVDDAGLERFALVAMAQGGPVALHYTARPPERVAARVREHLRRGHRARHRRRPRARGGVRGDDPRGLGPHGPLFRRVFTAMLIPDATEEQMRWVDDLHRRAVSARTAVESRRQRGIADASDVLAAITAPTLVLHSRHERMNDVEYSRILARGIPGARLVLLDSRNHILLEDEPAWPVFLAEVTAFLAEDETPAPAESVRDLLSPREGEVLALAAQGLDNAGIGAALTLSVRTVERHLQNAYGRLGVGGPTARAAAVGRWVREG